MRTDTVCWHCGATLTMPTPTAQQQDSVPTDADAAPREPQALLYLGLTAGVILLLLLITFNLGRRPLLLQGISSSAADWVALRGDDGRYTIHIPLEWQWLDTRDQAALIQQVTSSSRYLAALEPFAGLVDDEEPLLLAEGQDAFLILVRSRRLAGIAVADLLAALRAESFPISIVNEATAVENEAGQPAALLTVSQQDPPLACRQIILPGSSYGYLAAACTAPGELEAAAEQFETMLTSLRYYD